MSLADILDLVEMILRTGAPQNIALRQIFTFLDF